MRNFFEVRLTFLQIFLKIYFQLTKFYLFKHLQSFSVLKQTNVIIRYQKNPALFCGNNMFIILI